MMKLVITGSIGMGKSTTAKMFVEVGADFGNWGLYDVDKVVHQLYEKGGAAVAPLAEIFPSAIKNGAVDREALSKILLTDKKALKQLEAVVHPLAGAAQMDFLEKAEQQKWRGVIFDIPLFFETGADKTGFMDVVIVVQTSAEVQRERALARPTMSAEKFDLIQQKQMASEEKCRRADFVIETDKGLSYARKQVKTILETITQEKK